MACSHGTVQRFAQLLKLAQSVFCTYILLSSAAVAFFISKRLNDAPLDYDYLGPVTSEEICSTWGYDGRWIYAFCTVYNFVAGELINNTDLESSTSVSILIGCLLGIYMVKTILGYIFLFKTYKVKGSMMELIVWMIPTFIGLGGEILCVWWLQFQFDTFGTTYFLILVLAVIGGSSVAFDCFYIATLKGREEKFKYLSLPLRSRDRYRDQDRNWNQAQPLLLACFRRSDSINS